MFGMKSEQRVWGKSGQFEATMRVGVVLLGGWSAIGSRLDGAWNHPQLEQLSTRKHVLVTVCSG